MEALLQTQTAIESAKANVEEVLANEPSSIDFAMDSILIVDDDPMVRELLRRKLARQDREIEVVGSGVAALDRIRDGNIQLVILDLGLPDMDGMDVLARTKEASPETDVIVITANDAVPVAVEALRRGAADFLPKPVGHEQLGPVIDRILATRQMRLESDVATIMSRLASVLDVTELIPEVREAALDATRADHVTLFLWNNDVMEPATGKAVRGHDLLAKAVTQDGLAKRMPAGKQQRAMLAWPLVAHQEGIGILVVSREVGQASFNFEDERKLSIVATGAALEIDRARLIDHLQAQVDELMKARMQLSAAEHQQGIAALATGYAHELQGPLQAVQSQVRGALASMDDPKEASQHLRYALEGIARIQGAVGDLSLLGRNRDDTDVDAARLVNLAKRMAMDGDEIPVTVDGEELTVRGNVGLYTQALAQLLRNAVRACRDTTKPRIVVSIAEHKGKIKISIADNGHGIPKAISKRIYEPFFSTWEGHVGAGLGMVNGVVREVGGRLRLSANKGGGTIAAVLLPAGEEAGGLFALGDGNTLSDQDTIADDYGYDDDDDADLLAILDEGPVTVDESDIEELDDLDDLEELDDFEELDD